MRTLEHWQMQEELDQEETMAAYRSWDLNGDGMLQLDEFSDMVKFSNPSAGQRKITRAFIAASSTSGDNDEAESYVDTSRLGPALQLYGFTLKDRPENLEPGASVNAALHVADESAQV